jgi:hypothetical protein
MATINYPKENNTRIDRIERDLSSLTQKVINLSDLVAATNANVENLVTQVGGLFGKVNQPTNFNLLIAVMSLIIIIATLAFTPLYKADDQSRDFHETVNQYMIDQARKEGYLDAKLETIEDKL